MFQFLKMTGLFFHFMNKVQERLQSGCPAAGIENILLINSYFTVLLDILRNKLCVFAS